MIKKILSLSILAMITFGACKKETRSLKVIEEETILSYFKSKNLTGFIKDTSGFYYKIISLGAGEAVDYPDYVGVLQTTTSINKDVNYETSKSSPRFDYLGYIRPFSWAQSLRKINRGGRVRVITPSYLAFGKDGSGSSIPGNAILDTELSLVEATNQADYEDEVITNYLAEKNITATKDENGIYYQIITPGTGTAITSPSNSVKVAYTGKLLTTGFVFDQATKESPATLTLSNTIDGWRLALPVIKAGGKINLYIPSRYAYGANALKNIPSNSILEFEIELIEVKN